MRKIDRDTVQRILDAADIVEVVSDFVSLKRRGANYVGLCPFHNERTPSFSVSKSKGICKCFSCGKGGSPVNFIMELEQMTYNEALRYLAKKYNIEIQEQEMTREEIEEQSNRESMLAVNDFALHYFQETLTNTDDGRNIGLSYFYDRGINDAMISRFRLGYSLDRRDDLFTVAKRKGFNEKFLIDTGLCYKTEQGGFRDRFRGRVIFPVFTVSGKVVAFGGRTLRKDKDVAKYVNSPESVIYHKSHELYGLYQAKQAIVKQDKCILVEGYMDVISMHQSGVENVVASSGTSLTEGQIRLIHRFTENVTVIYDSDAAGIKASLRGIDLLLAEGLNVKVLQLPEGDDPDSFAQSHSSSEVEEYISTHEQDFIAFKTDILMKGIENDPIARSRAIQSIVSSISAIPDPITRTVYVGECSRSLSIDEKVLTLQVAKYVAEREEKKATDDLRRRNRISAGLPPEQDAEAVTVAAPVSVAGESARSSAEQNVASDDAAFLRPYEQDIVRYAVKYGMITICEIPDQDGNTSPMSVLDYIESELSVDAIEFTNQDLAVTYAAARDCSRNGWEDSLARFIREDAKIRERSVAEGIEKIRMSGDDLAMMERQERELMTNIDAECESRLLDFSSKFISQFLMSDADDRIRRTATELSSSRHHLSKIHTKYSRIPTETDRLVELVPLAVNNLKGALVELQIKRLNARLQQACTSSSPEEVASIMQELAEQHEIKKELAKCLGERILTPRIRR